ncbi:MAG: sugar ABC transporter substrate-binding protein [Alkalispirochaeta sp.]
MRNRAGVGSASGDARRKTVMVAVLTVLLVLGAVANGWAAGAGEEDSDSLTFGMVIKYPGTPYIEAFIHAAETTAEELGVELIVRDGEGDAQTIMNHMDTFILEEIDGFIMAGAVDQRAIVPGVMMLNEAEIPIVAIDTSPEGGEVDYFISADVTQQSAKAAEAFVADIAARHDGDVPEGVVIEITGDVRDMYTRAANEGFMSVVGRYPQLEVAQGDGKWNNIDSHDRTTDLLTRYGDDVLGVYVHTPDIMGPGVVEAIRGAGLTPRDYSITGTWMGPEGQALIRDGDVLGIVAMPAYAPAQMAVELLYDLARGNPVPQLGDVLDDPDAIWSPAAVKESPWADGLYIEMQAPIVPLEVDVDDPRLWENRLSDLW